MIQNDIDANSYTQTQTRIISVTLVKFFDLTFSVI